MSAGEDTRGEDARRHDLEAAARVAAGLLHEFRNVLNPIVSAAWLVEANANDPQKVIELARRIAVFAQPEERIAAKVRQLLDTEAAGQPAHPLQHGDVRAVTSRPEA
jgi:nitrogen-specific signal transduction histidine kinase